MSTTKRPALDGWLQRSKCLLSETESVDSELVEHLGRRRFARISLDSKIEIVLGYGAVLGDSLVSIVARETETHRQTGAILVPRHRFTEVVAHLGALQRYLTPSGR